MLCRHKYMHTQAHVHRICSPMHAIGRCDVTRKAKCRSSLSPAMSAGVTAQTSRKAGAYGGHWLVSLLTLAHRRMRHQDLAPDSRCTWLKAEFFLFLAVSL